MKYLKPIDPHVHLRGLEYADHDFIGMAMEDAEAVGLAALMEMPNPSPPITDGEKAHIRKCEFLNRFSDDEIRHYIHIGLTDKLLQLSEAFDVSRDNPVVRAVKVFFCHSTGRMGITELYQQMNIWAMAVEKDYRGVFMGHFEEENVYGYPTAEEWAEISDSHDLSVSLKKNPGFYPKKPPTHSVYQCEDAEVIQVKAQLVHALKAGFKGTFYICHVSAPKTVDAVKLFRETYSPEFQIVLEATWHHLFLNTDDYKLHGNRVKMNPPLRRPSSQRAMLEHLVNGDIDVIGTDHAPHPLEAKDRIDPHPASGIPAILFWPRGIYLLRQAGMDREHIYDLTFRNANKIFGLELPEEEITRDYDPSLWERYGWNPFERLG